MYVNGGGCETAPPIIMIVLSWNCRGLGNQATVRALKKLLHEKDPGIVFLMETKLSYTQMNSLNSRTLDFGGCIPVGCEGTNQSRSGGLCMLWQNQLNVTLIDYSSNHISLKVVAGGSQNQWQITGVYGWPERIHRHRTFHLLRRVAPTNNTPWMCMGDFNETFWSWEKRGGTFHRTRQMEDFWETASTLGLQDMGFYGNKFTWSNGRAGAENIMVRLDRALANPHWRSLFSGARVIHLPRLNSDHSPILICCDHAGDQLGNRG
ncbi:hypothetical protein ACS0TY_023661 [Phlomoides rotata]